MPKLLDIASVKIGKTVSANPRRTLYDLSNRLNKTELNNKNALRTSLTTGSEEKLGNIRIPEARDEDIFAGWMPKFNAKQNLDFFKPLQTEKPAPTLEDDVNELGLALKHKRWQEKLNETMANLDLSKYKG